MDLPHQQRWLRTAMLLGVVYLVFGVGFGALANTASHTWTVTWRLAAWVASAAVFAAHVAHEQLRVRNPPATAALHASVAAAIGAFGLAVAANLHAWWTASGNQRLLAIALVAWPALTALPAFAVALAMACVLGRMKKQG